MKNTSFSKITFHELVWLKTTRCCFTSIIQRRNNSTKWLNSEMMLYGCMDGLQKKATRNGIAMRRQEQKSSITITQRARNSSFLVIVILNCLKDIQSDGMNKQMRVDSE